jgi:hypothetical protein
MTKRKVNCRYLSSLRDTHRAIYWPCTWNWNKSRRLRNQSTACTHGERVSQFANWRGGRVSATARREQIFHLRSGMRKCSLLVRKVFYQINSRERDAIKTCRSLRLLCSWHMTPVLAKQVRTSIANCISQLKNKFSHPTHPPLFRWKRVTERSLLALALKNLLINESL